jgi:glycosidase
MNKPKNTLCNKMLLALLAPIVWGSVAAATAAVSNSSSGSASWQGQIIYQVMPDRFFDGDPSNNVGVNRGNLRAWHGGDLAGLTQKLEYIQKLGATAVWLTPIYQQTSQNFFDTAGYHGYWPYDFKAVDPHFGTLEGFKTLLETAHQKGIKVMLDQVVNHYGYGTPQEQAKPKWFHAPSSCAQLGNPEVFCPLSGLPDLAQENLEVRDFLFENNAFWTRLGVDAFRYDAVKHVPLEFMRDLTAQNKVDGVYTLGENFTQDPDAIAPFQKAGLRSMFDFPMQDALSKAVMGGGSLEGVRNVLKKDKVYGDPLELAIFLDNHDLPRFANKTVLIPAAQVPERLAFGLRALLTLRGIPVIYQGTEIGMKGGADPDNRQDMRFEEIWTPAEKTLFGVTQKAIAVRQSNVALTRGDLKLIDVPSDFADQLLLFGRSSGNQNVLVAWNTSKARITYSIRSSLVLQESSDLFGQNAKMTTKGGFLHLSLPPKSATVFVMKP